MHKIKILLFLLSTVLISCASNIQTINSPQVINQEKDFTIEGKFKIKINDFKENGYFVLEKKNNEVSLTLGKNYLLPERKILFARGELISFSKFFQENKSKIPPSTFPKTIEIDKFISVILGENRKNPFGLWTVSYLEKEEIKKGSKMPSKITLNRGNNSIELFLKKIEI